MKFSNAAAVSFTFVFSTGIILPPGNFAEQFDFKIEGNLGQSDAAITVLKSVDLATGKVTPVTKSNRTEIIIRGSFSNPRGLKTYGRKM
jgi:hypothetical protein